MIQIRLNDNIFEPIKYTLATKLSAVTDKILQLPPQKFLRNSAELIVNDWTK